MMIKSKILADLGAAAIFTLGVPFFFGYQIAKLFGIWYGISGGVGVWLLAAAILALFWRLCRRIKDRDIPQDRKSE